MALEGTTFSENELENESVLITPPPRVRSYIGEGAIETHINSTINLEQVNHIIRNRIHFQQTDDSYRPRRLTYPENRVTHTGSSEEIVGGIVNQLLQFDD